MSLDAVLAPAVPPHPRAAVEPIPTPDHARQPDAEAMVAVASDLFGPLEVPARRVFTFREGVYGFPECRRFALVSAGREGYFWLQSLEHGTLAFLLADPFPHFPDYTVELGATDRGELHVASAADIVVLCIVTLPHTRGEAPTANLQGPLAFNLAAGLGRQLAVGDTSWGVRCPLDVSA